MLRHITVTENIYIYIYASAFQYSIEYITLQEITVKLQYHLNYVHDSALRFTVQLQTYRIAFHAYILSAQRIAKPRCWETGLERS